MGYSCVILKGMHQVLNDSINAHELLKRKSLEDLVLNIHDELEIEQGIKVLDVDEEDINNLLEIIEKYPDMRCSLIEFRGTKKLEIRYHPYVEKYDVNELINMSIETYNRREFQACINCNLRILQVCNAPKDVVYSKIGLSYMRIGEIKKAIDYLIIADYLARKNGLSYNFDSLISKLEKEINVGENFGGRK